MVAIDELRAGAVPSGVPTLSRRSRLQAVALSRLSVVGCRADNLVCGLVRGEMECVEPPPDIAEAFPHLGIKSVVAVEVELILMRAECVGVAAGIGPRGEDNVHYRARVQLV